MELLTVLVIYIISVPLVSAAIWRMIKSKWFTRLMGD